MDIVEKKRSTAGTLKRARLLAAEQLLVEIRGNELLFMGNIEADKKHGLAKYHLIERNHGQFARKVLLPEALDVDAAEATLSSGVLSVVIPKLKQDFEVRVNIHVDD